MEKLYFRNFLISGEPTLLVENQNSSVKKVFNFIAVENSFARKEYSPMSALEKFCTQCQSDMFGHAKLLRHV